MKFLLTEIQIEKYFDDFLSNYRPELFDLARDEGEDDGKIYEYQFYDDSNLRLYFRYQFEKFWEKDKQEDIPKLIVTSKLANELKGFFGSKVTSLIKNWFEKEYNYPVKTVELR